MAMLMLVYYGMQCMLRCLVSAQFHPIALQRTALRLVHEHSYATAKIMHAARLYADRFRIDPEGRSGGSLRRVWPADMM